jgi:signal transduction histidine kinase
VSRSTGQRRHAARVALGATAVVAVVALVTALVTNTLIVNRLIHTVDVRLTGELDEASAGTSHPPPSDSRHNDSREDPDADADVDDAPNFVWRVDQAGGSSAITAGAPALPGHTWAEGPTTLGVNGSAFRFVAHPSDGGWLVAGESIAKIGQVRGDLILVELVLGALLLIVTFGGSFVVGLRASAPIEQIRRRQAEFTSDASHELRTPLSVIRAEVDLALSHDREPASYRATLERVASEEGRLRSIVDDLLWLARHDADATSPASDTVTDLRAVARECAERFDAVAVAGGLSLSRPVDIESPVPITADPEAVDRLVSVLLDNACRYASEGGSVRLGVSSAGGRASLVVDDSGPGIPAEQRQLVLDRFHRADDRPGGTGLGLSIADAVVRASHGTWSIGDSALGGARFGVFWRLVNDHDPGTGSTPRTEIPPVVPAPDGPGVARR